MKENIIIEILKLFILLFSMIMGFFLTYALIWFAVGLPQTDWALLLLLAVACLTEYGYYRWIRG